MKLPPTRRLARGTALAAFWAAAALTFVCALIPLSHPPHFVGEDKVAHMLAFFTLTFLATAAYPAHALAVIGAWLLMFGAGIELVQALPLVDRSGDLADLAADAGAIATALIVLGATGVRFRLLRMFEPAPSFVQAVHRR